jgi:dTDP-4-dehydrorhamnose reductase
VHIVEPAQSTGIELWGGLECTVNRVHNRYFDQLDLSGHSSRVSDIDLIASLGIRTIRYPVLWERACRSSGASPDWSWSDERLERLSRSAITPIVGLVHHGSGPRHTSLLDDRFPAKLAEYADGLASRYKELQFVTPINEPLTTARFSALYGHWFPHARAWPEFVAAIVNQCIATRESMRAMRAHIPHLKLVQTEDLGRIYSTPRLAYQARFENHRRWLTFDLLCGRVDDRHPMWRHLALDNALERQLQSLHDEPCPPDIIGINYYVTSDRFLDERIDLYPDDAIGGNGRDRYADVEAVRALGEGITGHSEIIEEAWNRYRIPVAITEAHMGCTREHQLRWLLEAWDGAVKAREGGCDVRAVTAWALFGSFGWDSLVTREPFKYEPGAFDVRSSSPRETALAGLIRCLATNGSRRHAAAQSAGWWRSETRLNVPAYTASLRIPRTTQPARRCDVSQLARPLLVTGATGTLGSAFVRLCNERDLPVVAVSRSEMDITDSASVRNVIRRVGPWGVVNAAGYVRVDDAESDRIACYRTNTVAVKILAAETADAGIPLMVFSSDLVFDGSKGAPYVESDRVSPLGAYGASKAAAEVRALSLQPDALVIRTSAFFGPWDCWNFATVTLRNLIDGVPVAAACDSIVSPTYVPDLVNTALDLLIDGEKGIWHLSNRGEISWSDFAREIASRAGLQADLIRPVQVSDLGLAARRPLNSALASERGQLLPSFSDALERWFNAMRVHELTSPHALQI